MKNTIRILPATLMVLLLLSVKPLAAQSNSATPSAEKVEIKTSAKCATCKKNIETALNKVDGIEKANLDVKTKIATVYYDPSRTDPDAIRTAITMSGYDADDMPADKNAYDHLDDCCKKDSDK